VTVVLVAVVLGCGIPPAEVPAEGDGAVAGKSLAPSDPTSFDLRQPVVRIETSAGPITVQLDAVEAPGTVRNFLDYVNEGFYDNSLIHFADPDKMIVAGGYATDRSPKSVRPPIRNEAHNGLKNTRGTIAMARDRSLIDSATSQFFINLADAPQRDHKGDQAADYGYCVFGKVIEGLGVAEQISKSPTENGGGDLIQVPQPPVVIKSIRLVR
jgi:peptidyl-prolyl cis-trans isomerase B (cyclophilin B)